MMRNKLLSLIIGFLVFVGIVIPTGGQGVHVATASDNNAIFKDLPSQHWALEAILWGYNEGIVQGDVNGNFNPGSNVTEPEFLAMFVRAYANDLSVRTAEVGEKWYIPYFDLATENFWHLSGQNSTYQRNQVANITYSLLEGSYKSDTASIQFLLDATLSAGKSSATVEGYAPYDKLTRAEAIVFIKRMKELYPSVQDYVGKSISYTTGLRNVSIGDTETTLVSQLGKPDRKDASEFNYTWYVYNRDYNSFAMYAVSSDNKVVALYSNARNVWGQDNALTVGSSYYSLQKYLGKEVKLNVSGYIQQKDNGINTNFYLDQVSDNVVDGIMKYDTKYRANGTATQEQIDAAYEQQILDVTNVLRNKFNLKNILIWNEKAAKAAYLHSKDMRTNKYFNHTNLAGLDAQARMKDTGLTNFGGSENIASAYEDAFTTYIGWVNSPGHRKNMLEPKYTQLGVGAYQGYYTQNFVYFFNN